MVFNPIIEYLQIKSECGFNLNEKKIITLPNADDFCLITTDLRKHQKIQIEIKSKIEIMDPMNQARKILPEKPF